jgi:hypothetical protein
MSYGTQLARSWIGHTRLKHGPKALQRTTGSDESQEPLAVVCGPLDLNEGLAQKDAHDTVESTAWSRLNAWSFPLVQGRLHEREQDLANINGLAPPLWHSECLFLTPEHASFGHISVHTTIRFLRAGYAGLLSRRVRPICAGKR